ncbi:MAG TPA: OmpA family protein [Treponemataceae bacterium]|nr:OmpA family protein [Treponemataceae bacterium]
MLAKNKKRVTIGLLIPFVLILFTPPAGAEIFRFKHQKGNTSRIISTTDENIYINGELSHHSIIVNRIFVEVKDVKDNGVGILETHYMTTENADFEESEKVLKWGQEYYSIFERNARGEYTISDDYFMPVVRNVPVFPEYDVQPGDTWTFQGEEAHDLRQTFNIEKPYKIPFTAEYTYKGTIEEKGRKLHIILVNYTIMYKSPKKPTNAENYPVKNFIYSNETLYWDNERGALVHYDENFHLLFEMSLGNIYEFVGTAHAYVTEQTIKNTKSNRDTIKQEIDNLNIDNTTAEITERGIKISLEKIRFKAESADLMNSEKEKLKKIASILSRLPENDLLIEGHTAQWGSEESQMQLSEERAHSVAHYLLSLKVKDASQIFIKGHGGQVPIAPNDSEENMARNRRVEITVLDN